MRATLAYRENSWVMTVVCSCSASPRLMLVTHDLFCQIFCKISASHYNEYGLTESSDNNNIGIITYFSTFLLMDVLIVPNVLV